MTTKQATGFFSRIDEATKHDILKRIRKFFNFDPYMKVLEIDFSKPWYTLFFKQKWYLILNLVNQLVYSVVSSIFPLIVGYIVTLNRLDYLLYVIWVRIAMRVLSHILFRYHPLYEINLVESIKLRAYEFLIKVDPEFHATRSSGQIISKINRGAQGFWGILDIALFNILVMLVSLTAITISLFALSPSVSSLVLVLFIILMVVSIIGFRLRTIFHYKVRVEAQDKATAVSVESMQQAQYIRASFSTQSQINEMKSRSLEFMINQAMGWRWSAWMMTPIQIIYYLGMLGFIVILWEQNLNPAILAGAILSIASLGSTLYDIGRTIDRFIQCIEDVIDLWDFMRNFGAQTYPVLDSDMIEISSKKNK